MEIKLFGTPYDWLLFACLELVQLGGAFIVYVGFQVSVLTIYGNGHYVHDFSMCVCLHWFVHTGVDGCS